jgi:lysophospholipase L1-like esterase
MTCTLLGSKYDWSTDNRNEGWSGKTAQWFCTNASSPLSNNGVCDFAHYLSVNSIDTPDFVFINLGTNDVNISASGYDAAFVTYISQMIESIHSVSNNIVVIVGLCEGVCTLKDTNNAGFTNWDLNQKISNLHKATITAFDNRQNENIYICPMYMGMDLKNDYNMTEVPLSKRDGDLNNGSGNGKTRKNIADGVHQSEVGYWKNADYMYAIVKYIMAKSLI